MNSELNITLIMLILNALGIVLFAIGMFLLKSFSGKVERILGNITDVLQAIAVLQEDSKHKEIRLAHIEGDLKEKISTNSVNLETCFKIIDRDKKELTDNMSKRFHVVNNKLQKMEIYFVKNSMNKE